MSIIRSIKGKDLPADWAARIEAEPEQTYTIYIEPDDPGLDRAESLSDMMRIIGMRAKNRGLTEEALRGILNKQRPRGGR